MNYSIQPIDKFILKVVSILLIVDMINGILIRSNFPMSFSFSQIIKISLIALMAYRISQLSKIKTLAIFLITLGLTFIYIVNTLLNNNFDYLHEFIVFNKLLLIPISALYFSEMVKLNQIQILPFYKSIVYVSLSIICINIIAGKLGFGFEQYSGGVGSRGYFYAGNEVAALLLLLSGIVLYWNLKTDYKKYILISLFLFIVSILNATKVCIFGIFILIIFMPFIKQKNINIKQIIKYISAFLAVTVLFIFSIKYIWEFTGLNSRWNFFIAKYDYNIWSMILSGRNIVLDHAFTTFTKQFSILNYIFGISASGFLNKLEQQSSISHAIEMDFFDIFFYYGVLGILIVYSTWIYIITKCLALKNNTSYTYTKLVLFMSILLLFISTISGHVMYSGMSGIFIGLLFSFSFITQKKVEQ